jgi:hypothetical protein
MFSWTSLGANLPAIFFGRQGRLKLRRTAISLLQAGPCSSLLMVSSLVSRLLQSKILCSVWLVPGGTLSHAGSVWLDYLRLG